MINQAPFAITERLHGYLPQESYFENYREMFQDPEFVKSYGLRLSNDDIKRILKRDADYWECYGFGSLVWFDKSSNEFVGEGGLNHAIIDDQKEIELTYSLKKEVWGQGLASEIGEYALNYAFQLLKLNSLVCFTMPTNKRSLRVMQKLGFAYERDFIHANLPHVLYRLTTARS